MVLSIVTNSSRYDNHLFRFWNSFFFFEEEKKFYQPTGQPTLLFLIESGKGKQKYFA